MTPGRMTDAQLEASLRDVKEALRRHRAGRLRWFLAHVSPVSELSLAVVWACLATRGDITPYYRIFFCFAVLYYLRSAWLSARSLVSFRRERREAIVEDVMES